MNPKEAADKLTRRCEELRNRLERIRSDRRRAVEPLSPDFAEQAVERENDETLDFLDERTRSELADAERALARVDEGTFGVCASCGADISPQRLELVPSTSLCVGCAKLAASAEAGSE